MIDRAPIRPGRFDKIVLVPMPDKAGRIKILEISSRDIPIDREMGTANGRNPNYVDIEKIAESADGLSGADVAAIANTATSLLIHEFIEEFPDPKEAEKQVENSKVTMRHFEAALKKVRIQKDLKVGEKVSVSYYR